MQTQDFSNKFELLTGSSPFPWQVALYQEFVAGKFPSSATIPTGLGKTSIVAVWLLALAKCPSMVPRRLVYVVNRRTVVDQTTTEVERLRKALPDSELAGVFNALAAMCALPLPEADASPLAISTLRGQFADNGEWCADPSRPSVIVGTVDMIGSGLLFSRYSRGFKTRPLHAGFLAQDALIVHDEAHLEPAFQKLLDSIVAEQERGAELRKLRVIELTATSRIGSSQLVAPFTLSDADRRNDTVVKRVNAVKRLSLVSLGHGEKLEAKLVSQLNGSVNERSVLVFIRSVETAVKVAAELDKGERQGKVATLTGTMRGKERDELVSKNPVFQRFLPARDRAVNVKPESGTVYLVATSAGEVGVNISADDLVCDLSTFESMAQRFGRVNRFGECDDSTVVVIHESDFDATKPIELARDRTLALLRRLDLSANASALDGLPADERVAAFSPPPAFRVATEIHYDAWSLTSIREAIATRPPVAPYLHGEAEWQPSETRVAWRKEIDVMRSAFLIHAYPPGDLLEDFPIKPHELLRDTTKRVFASIKKAVERIAKEHRGKLTDEFAAWVVDADNYMVLVPLSRFLTGDERIAAALESTLGDATLILPESLGCIENGLLEPSADSNDADVADIVGHRIRVLSRIPTISATHLDAGFRLVRAIDTRLGEEGGDDSEGEAGRYWLWLEQESRTIKQSSPARTAASSLFDHSSEVAANAAAIAAKLLPNALSSASGDLDLGRCVVIAARLHDLGKNRRQWQHNLGNLDYDPEKPKTILAKTAPGMRSRNVAEHYRHEFGSLRDGSGNADFIALSVLERDIVLHIVATHHGRARPHFALNEIFDYTVDVSAFDHLPMLAAQISRRFARLQNRFGRWGLAWLESLLRAADYAASAGIVASIETDFSVPTPRFLTLSNEVDQGPTARISVNPANPGHYFACCGLLEIASRLMARDSCLPVLGWFEKDVTTLQWCFNLNNSLPLLELLEATTDAEISAVDVGDRAKSALEIRFQHVDTELRLDWWRHEGGNIGKLKPWAGNTSVRDIADDMRQALKTLLGDNTIDAIERVLFATSITNRGEPFYFDANRAVNARAQDVGFSADKIRKGGVRISTAAAPAVELLSLVGLQRSRPPLVINERGREREYDYHLWRDPLPVSLLPAAVAGLLSDAGECFRFSNPSRAKDYRAFVPAKNIS